jgi:hypothetical protein
MRMQLFAIFAVTFANADITFRYSHSHPHYVFTNRIRALIEVIIRYLHIK